MVNPNGYASAVLADAPLAYWQLDDATTTALDSASTHDGAYYTPYLQLVSTPVPEGSAASFSGGRVVVPHTTALNMTGDYTIEGFLRWTGTAYGMVFRQERWLLSGRFSQDRPQGQRYARSRNQFTENPRVGATRMPVDFDRGHQWSNGVSNLQFNAPFDIR